MVGSYMCPTKSLLCRGIAEKKNYHASVCTLQECDRKLHNILNNSIWEAVVKQTTIWKADKKARSQVQAKEEGLEISFPFPLAAFFYVSFFQYRYIRSFCEFVYTIQDLKKKERELMAKEAELNRREQVYTS